MSDITVVAALQRLYDSIARRSPSLGYLNFGFADPDEPRGDGNLARLEKLCRRLYEEVLGSCPAAGRVLEIGCGRGGGAAYLLQERPGLEYLGLDLSTEHVCACRRRLASLPLARFAVADAARLPVPSACFDAALSVEACHHFEDLDAFYGEVARVLRRGGVLLLAGIWEAGRDSARRIEARGLRVLERADITANVVASLSRTGALRQELVNALDLPERFRPFLMSWAGVRGSGSYEELASGERVYLRYRLQRP
ncbi:MAG TPA: class I SAM-dependent methyltransferase [Vicinamibacteria bacterium]|nr:class I SAM-dependent methyltransferase [Vicinamibacteria bacterium]